MATSNGSFEDVQLSKVQGVLRDTTLLNCYILFDGCNQPFHHRQPQPARGVQDADGQRPQLQ